MDERDGYRTCPVCGVQDRAPLEPAGEGLTWQIDECLGAAQHTWKAALREEAPPVEPAPTVTVISGPTRPAV